MLHRSIFCCVVLLSSSASFGIAAEVDRWDPHLVVLATVSDLDSAREEAERASNLLGYGIDGGSLRVPEAPRKAEGALVSVHRTKAGSFEIVCCLADESRLDGALTRAKRFYPSARVRPEPHGIETYYLQYSRSGVIVAGSYRSYEAAVRGAEALEAASGIPLGTRGLVYDETHGLIWPEDSDDDAYTGSLYRRRYDSDCLPHPGQRAPCLTVEPTEAYDGFEPGYYIVVAGVLGRGPERNERLRAVREFVPDAYVKETNIWMGCIH